MSGPSISLDELRDMMNPQFVMEKKIHCIKLLRAMTGEGLKEAKDFFEDEWLSFVTEGKRPSPVKQNPELQLQLLQIERRMSELENDMLSLKKAQTRTMAANIFTEGD